ncbi:hypothetical protein [Opitutus terrae]|uniref:Uncharacterized protein n=1 Tax=Opitutus terrae (strain DSM 11246 / JCM 15787 / PB90-1) TaxID=452637 RepID=B1ZTZ0_OPITP|nr:hypothetical protein [Opitutus terrae]ACB75872.1 hypothetical protein Oter_2590 [Opitutus terrae PB90-1]
MSASEKLQLFDLPVALALLAFGVPFLSLRKKMSIACMERVKKAELSADEAAKADRLVFWCGSAVTACGLLLIGLWAGGY